MTSGTPVGVASQVKGETIDNGSESIAAIDTASSGKLRTRTVRTLSTSARDVARYLVAEYLHDWGLRDPDVVAAESRRIVEQAESLTADVPPERLERELSLKAIHLTAEEVEAAIARMAVSYQDGSTGVPTNDSIVPRLASVLLEFPDAIRHRDRPPARLLAVLESSVSPIIPHCHRREMRPQPRTRLWKILRRGYWKCFRQRFRSWRKRVWEFAR